MNDVVNGSSTNENQSEKLIRLLEEQLAHTNQQNQELTKQIESLTQQLQHLTKLLYGSKTEKSKYNAPDGQGSLKVFEHLSPSKRRKKRQKFALPIVRNFLDCVEKSSFYGKNALAKAAEYSLNRANELKAFLKDGRIEIDNNPAKNAIRPNLIGRKNWLFSVSEAGAKTTATCLSIAETAKANGVDFYRYLLKLLTDLKFLDIYIQKF